MRIEQRASESANGNPRILVDRASREPYRTLSEIETPEFFLVIK